MRLLSLSLWLLAAAAPLSAWGWNKGGHMMVAHIAYERLTPAARREVDRLIAIRLPVDAVAPAPDDFMSASYWADDVRPLDEYKYTYPYHFIEMLFSADGTPLPPGRPDPENIVRALSKYVALLRAAPASDETRAEALRFVIHFVGDIHQPLHAGGRVTQALPGGDRGGNDFPITLVGGDGVPRRTNLHAFWDNGIDRFPRMGPNFAPPPKAQIPPAARRATALAPESPDAWKEGGTLGFAAWVAESNRITGSVVYRGLVEGGEPSAAYRKEAAAIAYRRVAWAGYRLARLLNEVWP